MKKHKSSTIIWGGGQSVIFHCVQTFFCLVGDEVTGWCVRALVLSLKWLPSTGVGAWVPTEELKDTAMYILWGGGTRTLPHSSLFELLFSSSIPSLPWLATVWICPLELREGQGGWRKPIFYKQEMGDTEKICIQEHPTGSCSVSISLPPFFDTSHYLREQVLDKKENNVLDRQMNHKLGSKTCF